MPAPPEGRTGIGDAIQVPAFWLLAGSFFVCGYTSNGLVLTHLVPHAAEHGFSEMHAAQALGVMGAMNILGTVLSGWICDRFGRKGPLAFYYGVRGLSLLFLLYVWNVPSLHIFAAIFGLNYISTVPPTTTLTANIFGRYSVGTLSGWIFFAHQAGAALGAAVGGWIFTATGSYTWAFTSAALMAFLAVPMALAIKEAPVNRTPRDDRGARRPARHGGLAGWSRMMGMTNDGTTKLTPDFARDFPFESRLSLASLIRFWDEQAKDPSVCGEMARVAHGARAPGARAARAHRRHHPAGRARGAGGRADGGGVPARCSGTRPTWAR